MSNSTKNDSFVNDGKTSKIERYGWTLKDAPGKFKDIHKDDLITDPIYQRESSQDKVRSIAKNWSWKGCGCILVAYRNGKWYVFDGDHRVLGARARADITTLPCMVYECVSIEEEAEGFLIANTSRKPVTAIQKFGAQVIAKDEVAVKTMEILKEHNYVVAGTIAAEDGRVIKCLRTLSSHVRDHEDTLRRVFPLVVETSGGGPIYERVLEAIMYTEVRLERKTESLTRHPWRTRLVKLGTSGVLEATARAASYHAKGGCAVWGRGLVHALNKGVRNRLTLDDGSDSDDEV